MLIWKHATGLGNDDVQDPNTVLKRLTADANAWALSFCRDFRALHQLNHDHDCTHTCIKYVKKGKESAEKALKKGWTVACRFFFYHVFILTYMCAEAQKMITKAFRRRGKKLAQAAHIASTNEHGELFRVSVTKNTPFRSAKSDVGQVWSRSNHDFQFMPRFLDLEVLHELGVEGVPPPAVDPKLALAMYGVRLRLPDEPLLRRCFHSIAAMFQRRTIAIITSRSIKESLSRRCKTFSPISRSDCDAWRKKRKPPGTFAVLYNPFKNVHGERRSR